MNLQREYPSNNCVWAKFAHAREMFSRLEATPFGESESKEFCCGESTDSLILLHQFQKVSQVYDCYLAYN